MELLRRWYLDDGQRGREHVRWAHVCFLHRYRHRGECARSSAAGDAATAVAAATSTARAHARAEVLVPRAEEPVPTSPWRAPVRRPVTLEPAPPNLALHLERKRACAT
jgi:hypothetical protein